MHIRNIKQEDNPEVAALIRTVLTEFGANRPGFAWQDPELDNMSRAYDTPHSVYKVIVVDGRIIGGAGIGVFDCSTHQQCCELQKMYLYPEFRGKGWGKSLIEALLAEAGSMGYQHCYLESLSTMTSALKLYQEQGFKTLDKPLGDSGHNACDRWLIRRL